MWPGFGPSHTAGVEPTKKRGTHTSSGHNHKRAEVREDGYLSPFSSTVSASHWLDPVDDDQAQNKTTTGEVKANDHHPRLVLYLW